jgi:serine/threonine protein kinase
MIQSFLSIFFFHLSSSAQDYFPTTLGNAEMATPFRLSQKTTPGPSETYESEQEAIQALRFLVAELTLGLLFLHRHGIVHQDIKPANIMISERGHAVIGEFSAASALPVPCQSGGNFLEGQSGVDEDGMTYGSIVLQPEDTVTFTPLYAAPELLERKEDGLLIYDERADWWSLGVTLYEITTGGIPFHISSDAVSIGKGRRDDGTGLLFDLLEGLDLIDGAAHGCDAHLDGYLRSVNFLLHFLTIKDSHNNIVPQLLVHDPNHRLSGERAKSHPFLEPLQDIWTEIEDLRHPPCPKPSARILNGEDIDISSFDLQEDSSKFDAECTQISYSGREPEPPQTPYEEYYTARQVFSSPGQRSLDSPPFLIRRREALAVKRPEGQVLWNDNEIDSNRLQESESSMILQQEAFMSYYIEASFQTSGSLSRSVGNPLSSTGSAGRFFSDEHAYGTCTIQRRNSFPEEEDIVRAETSFNDSGLDFPLGSSPESWGHRKTDSFRKPLALQPICELRFQGLAKDRGGGGGRIYDEILAKTKNEADVLAKTDLDWTFDEKITISLLQASWRERERSEPTIRSRLSKPQVVAAASERIVRAAGRRVVEVLTRWRQ